eukprot:14467867-Ditylum_brightwellii.AAC.1
MMRPSYLMCCKKCRVFQGEEVEQEGNIFSSSNSALEHPIPFQTPTSCATSHAASHAGIFDDYQAGCGAFDAASSFCFVFSF